jgi:hypothetical protein
VRFVFAIVALIAAAVLILLGIAQRTVFLQPGSTSLQATVSEDTRYAVLDSSALTAFSGSQTIQVDGPGKVFLAYGRTEDVLAWLGDDSYANIGLSADSAELEVTMAQGTPVEETTPAEAVADAPTEAPVSNPSGSDLWLGEASGESALSQTINVPPGISVLIASDGEGPVPSDILVEWPINNSTPWAGPLIVGGAVLAALGLGLYLWALLHLKRSRGPRRNLPRGPRRSRLPRVPRPKSFKASQITGPRRAITRSFTVTVPALLITGLVLSGCSADFWPQASSTPVALPAVDVLAAPTPTPGSTDDAEAPPALPTPAVTVPQMEAIIARIAELTATADASLDAEMLATRFIGPALEQRAVNYQVRGKIADAAGFPALNLAPVRLTLPQQTSAWPRTVMTVLQDPANLASPTLALVLRQESPRENYMVEYAVQLEAAPTFPDVAPASIGAPVIAPDSKLLLLPPDEVALAYGDILLQGEDSPFFDLFEAEGDTFRTQVGVEFKRAEQAKLPSTASMDFTIAAGSGRSVALATNDSGSLVVVSLNEIVTVKPVDADALVSTQPGPSQALSGVTSTAKGVVSTYGEQLFFYLPAAGSTDKIILLGMSQGLISAAELP